MSVLSNNTLAGSSGQGGAAGYAIDRSLRFNPGDSSNLSKTYASAGNRKTFTLSLWCKRGNLSGSGTYSLFGANSGSASGIYLAFHNDGLRLRDAQGGTTYRETSTKFRDPSSWYHIVLAINTTESTANDRIKLYVNGTQLTSSEFSTTNNPSSSADLDFNSANGHMVGALWDTNYTGNVFAPFDGYLADVHFIDGQALAASDFGETDSNEVWQPIEFTGSYNTTYSSSYANFTTHGNVDGGSVSNLFDGDISTIFEAGSSSGNIVFTPPSGIAYSSSVEVYTARTIAQAVSLNGGSNVSTAQGWNTINSGSGTLTSLAFYNGSAGNQNFSAIRVDGTILTTGTFGGVNGFHLDFSDGADLGNDSSGANNDWTPNNLVGQLQTGDQGMDVVTYSGTGSTQTISGLKFQPDLIWFKPRQLGNHKLIDSVRGKTKRLESDTSDAEETNNDSVLSFNSDGFTIGSAGTVNNSTNTFVAWAWKAGGAAVSNTDGSTTSSVSVNQTYGFSIVSYTGNGNNTNSATSPAVAIGHGLSAAPSMIIVKDRTSSRNWPVYHVGTGTNSMCELDTSGAAQSTYSWNQTAPSSSVFYVGNNGQTNNNGNNYIAYCWSEVAGYSKFGSYTGNGSSTGPVITTGFKPRFILLKRTDVAQDWVIMDTARNPSNVADKNLYPNLSDAEYTYSRLDFLSNGFQLRATSATSNASGGTYIYMAFAAGGDGADLDSLLDTPEQRSAQTDSGAGGEVVGNYATLNPLDETNATLSNGNLDVEVNSAGTNYANGTIAISSGKWYFETTAVSGVNNAIGVADINGTPGFETSGSYVYYQNTGALWHTGANSYGASWQTAGDVIGIAIDMDTPQLIFYKNGVSQGVAVTSWLSGKTVVPCFTCGGGSGNKVVANFGARAFTHAAPSGYSALCTANLPEPTIAAGNAYFDTKLYTGNGGTQTLGGLGFSPDFLWVKSRSSAVDHILFDSIRGFGANKELVSNGTYAEGATGSGNPNTDVWGFVESVTSDGFVVNKGSNSNGSVANTSGSTYAAWAWDAGSSTVTNTDGSISAQVRANPTAGFSIVTFTGTGANTSVGHGLNAAPQFVMAKTRTKTDGWPVYHSGGGSNYQLFINQTDAGASGTSYFNGAPTSSVVNLGINSGSNQSGQPCLLYCFAPVEGYSAFGSYTGNGSADGPFVYTGFRPRWVLLKNASATSSWMLFDTARNDYNTTNKGLFADLSNAENSGEVFDILSNGFKPRATPSWGNYSGNTHIYIAFAENPFKTSRAR